MGLHIGGVLQTRPVVEECFVGLESSGAAAVSPRDLRYPVGRCVSKSVSRPRFARGAMIRPRSSSPQTLQGGVGVGSPVAEEIVDVESRGARGDDRIDFCAVAE